MSNRIDLHNLLLTIGGPNVYYQVPSTLTMKYPAIRYSINSIDNEHADDSVYCQSMSYSITVMSKEADSDIVDKISKLPKCRFDRRYVIDNIYHTIFNIYY
jgi:hypothetical protein